MKSVLVQFDAPIAKLLDKYVPGRGRKRSKFIRQAVLRALMELVEVETEKAYRRRPQETEWWFDPSAWAPADEAYVPTPEEKAEIDRLPVPAALHTVPWVRYPAIVSTKRRAKKKATARARRKVR